MPKGRPLPPHKDTGEPDGKGRDEKGRIVPGTTLNPAGRPKGARDKLAHALLADLYTVWEETGIEGVRKVAKKDPRSFLMACIAVMPKILSIDETRRIYRIREQPLTSEEWQQKHAGGAPIEKANGGPVH